MDGVPNRIARVAANVLAPLVVLASLTACVSLEEIAVQSGIDPVTWQAHTPAPLACHAPPASDHRHPPGDIAWVGHTQGELVAALGQPSFQIGKPHHVHDGPEYVVAVYTDAGTDRSGCIDAYARNPCGVITAHHCR